MKSLLILISVCISTLAVISDFPRTDDYQKKIAFSIEQLSTKKNVDEILLSHKSLVELPEEVSLHPEAKKIVLSKNFLVTLPDFIKDFKSLEYLDLSENHSIDLNQVLAILNNTKIHELRLASCNLAYIPFKIGQLKSLQYLDLSHNFLIDFPLYSGKLKNLEYLNLSNNQLTDLDKGIWKCKDLKMLDISGMKNLNMENICHQLGPLKKLQSIRVSHLIDTLPEAFGAIKTNSWIIDHSHLNYLPNSFSSNENINSISFESCPSSDFKKLLPILANIPKLSELRLISSLQEIPEEIKLLKSITSLDLSHNHLKSLTFSSDDFPSLKELILYGNDFSKEEWDNILNNFPNCNILINNIPVANSVTKSSSSGNSVVSPPFKQIELANKVAVLDPSVSNQIEMEGTIINIPKNAFVNASGKLVDGNVEVLYQQFDDPLEIFLSGIPMKYDSSEISTYFESAGMFNLTASFNGEEVFLAKDKLISIDFASVSRDANFNLYSLNTESGKWNYEVPSTITPLTPEESIVLNNWNTGKPKSPNISNKPTMQTEEIGVQLIKTKGKYYYSITLRKDNQIDYPLDLPQIIDVKKHQFIYPDESMARKTKSYLSKYFGYEDQSKWKQKISKKKKTKPKSANDVLFEVDDENDCFRLTIAFNDTILELPMKLESIGSNFEKEQKRNAGFWKNYGKSLSKTRKGNENIVAAYETAMLAYEKNLETYQNVFRDWYNNNPNKKNVTRQVIIDRLGVWNCDRIPVMDSPQVLAVEIKRQDGSSFNSKEITVLDYTGNGSMNFSNRITYDKKNKIALIIFGEDEYAFVSCEDFASVQDNIQDGRVTITANVLKTDQLTFSAIESMIL